MVPRRAWLVALAVAGALGGAACRTGTPPAPADGLAAARSGPIALTRDGRALWVVNPDADSVTRVDLVAGEADAPLPVAAEPWSVAVGHDGRVVVAGRAAGALTVWHEGARRDLPVGAEPASLVLSRDGRHAYVALAAEGRVVRVDLDDGRVVAAAEVGEAPEALVAFAADDGATLVAVAHLRGPARAGAPRARRPPPGGGEGGGAGPRRPGARGPPRGGGRRRRGRPPPGAPPPRGGPAPPPPPRPPTTPARAGSRCWTRTCASWASSPSSPTTQASRTC